MALQPIPIYGQQETFYVPQVVISVNNKDLPDNVINDILEVTYKDSVNDIDSFTIEINNWDADKRTFKFVPPLKDATVDYTGTFDPGASIEQWMGYQNNMRQMICGQITSLSPVFSESAAPTLSISGLNELHQYRTEKYTRSWLDGTMTDTQIATQICKLPVQQGQAGLDINIDPHPAPNEMPRTFVYMKSQYDIVFILETRVAQWLRRVYRRRRREREADPILRPFTEPGARARLSIGVGQIANQFQADSRHRQADIQGDRSGMGPHQQRPDQPILCLAGSLEGTEKIGD